MVDYLSPQTITDVVADGIFAQAEYDSDFNSNLGSIAHVDVESAGDSFVVHFKPTFGSIFTANAEQVAVLNSAQGMLHWTSPRAHQAHTSFNIPEFEGDVPYSPSLFAAARTLHGNRPALYAPQRNGETPVLVLDTPPPTPNSRRALTHGIPSLLPTMDIRRALRAYAAATGLGIYETDTTISFSDGTDLTLEDNLIKCISGDFSLDDFRADAFYFNVEQQLLFDALYPNSPATPTAQFDPVTSLLTLFSQFEAGRPALTVHAMVLATVRDDTWTWAWASNLPPHLQQASLKLRETGAHLGIPAFLYPQLPVSLAESWGVLTAVKPPLQRWIHTAVPLGDGTTAVLLFDHPELRLPTATTDALHATLQTPLPAELDARQAVRSYARLRGVNSSFDQLEEHAIVHAPEAPIHVTFDGDHHLLHTELPV